MDLLAARPASLSSDTCSDEGEHLPARHGVVAVTSFATIPDETIAERVGHCRFLVDLKTEELVVSLRDPTKSVDVTFRYVTTVGCDGKVSAVDIFDDSGAVEHMLRDAGDLP